MKNKKTSQNHQFISKMMLCLVSLIFCIGLFVPIYSDEVAIHMAKARFILEDGRLVNLLPQCEFLITNTIPLTWYPAAIVHGFLYAIPGPIGLRLTGISLGLLYLCFLWVWVGKSIKNECSKNIIRALIISFNGLGVLPFILILTRSEQNIILSLISICMLSIFWKIQESDSIQMKGLKVSIFAVLISIFFYAHPKSLFFMATIFAAMLHYTQKANFYLKLGLISWGGLTIYQTFVQAKNINCLGAPIVSKMLSSLTIDFSLLQDNKLKFIEIGLTNIVNALFEVIDKLLFNAIYQSNWLPSHDASNMLDGVIYMNALIKGSLTIGIVVLLIVFAYQFIRKIMIRQINKELILASSLVVGLMAHAFVYNIGAWHFYTPGLIIPVFSMIFLLVIFNYFEYNTVNRPMFNWFAYYWIILSICSSLFLGILMFPNLLKNARENNYFIVGQKLSTPIFSNENRKDKLHVLANSCNIKINESKRLMVDGLTYLEFKKQKESINILYISDYGFGVDLEGKVKAFLNKVDSDGVISRCDYIPKELKKDAIEIEGMCCVAKEHWAQ